MKTPRTQVALAASEKANQRTWCCMSPSAVRKTFRMSKAFALVAIATITSTMASQLVVLRLGRLVNTKKREAICEKTSEFPLVRGGLANTIANFAFLQTPSEIKGSNHKIDGFFGRIDLQFAKGEEVPSSVVAINAGFKKNELLQDAHDNRLKIVAAANHLMNEDPRRMFTYGITIEDDDVSSVDPKTFVSVLLSFIFAAETELSFDPAISRRSPVSYVCQVIDRFFETIRISSEYWPLCIADRMTRVWEAVGVESLNSPTPKRDARHVVLKDVWLDASAQTEKEIQAALFSGLEEFGQTIEYKDPEQFTSFSELRR
ncbi:hypothetical protein NLJ89_g7079 [Agrocybe chaxingu]|uniref:Fungal-type protein kinase domain-containing protein n=1 Tax=Agrocybe chaxingu TaxID=84603 RepID=A0A9W8JX19_9AGAR|nr:hypothetical protein NLJ89_g7079 [Agrocybe chaxingu]